MRAVPTDEERMLRESAAGFAAAEWPIERVRRVVDGHEPLAAGLKAAGDQGWLGILVPEAAGGLGLGVRELGLVLEELGRAMVPVPVWSAAALGVPAVAFGESDAARNQWLERLVAGERRATLALLEDAGLPEPARLGCRAAREGQGYSLTGVKRFVPDLEGADAVAVVAAVEEGPVVLLLDARAPGVDIQPNRGIDGTTSSGTLALDGVHVAASARLGGWDLVERLLAYANVGIAAQAIGGATAVLKQAVAYVRQRIQFGVPVGTFQAVQHPLANLFAEIESARSAYVYAAWAVDAAAPDRSNAVALARLLSTEVYRNACRVSLQVHGGIGFTWEYDLHLHLKRSVHFENLLGVREDYEEQLAARALGLDRGDDWDWTRD